MKSPNNRSVKTILVVEDEPTITDVCQRVLTTEGFEVDIAVNGKVAQEMVEKKRYALCLIDIRKPKMNGMELFRWLKDNHPGMVKGVVFTTGDVMGGASTDFIGQSGRPFLPKPFAPIDLMAIISEAFMEVEK